MEFKYGNLYELGREGHKGFSHYNDLPIYGYLVDFIGSNSFPENGYLFLESCREEKILVHYSPKLEMISFPEDQNLISIRKVVKIEKTEELTNPNLKIYLITRLIPFLYKKNLEKILNK